MRELKITYSLQCKGADHILSKRFDLHKGHLEVSVHLSIIWPVLITLNLDTNNKQENITERSEQRELSCTNILLCNFKWNRLNVKKSQTNAGTPRRIAELDQKQEKEKKKSNSPFQPPPDLLPWRCRRTAPATPSSRNHTPSHEQDLSREMAFNVE